jgi:alcohol dehydrogenase class IV
MFNLKIPTNVLFGLKSRDRLFDVLDQNNWENIGVIIDGNLRGLPLFEEFLGEISQRKNLATTNCEISEPTYDSLENVRTDFCKPSLDCIIGIGGGSAIDMAKAMAVLVHNDKPAIAYRGFDKMDQPVLPIIAIPTTSGTGTEVTPNASFVDSAEKKKMGINGEAVRPKYAFLDPELTLSCPLRPTVSAAVDSIVHATEAFVAKKSNPIAKFFAREGFQKVIISLPKLIEDLNSIELRTDVMYGAFLSGIALMHSGTGPAAALSYPLGVHYGVPHGIGGAVFLPSVVRFNIGKGSFLYSGLLEGHRDFCFKNDLEGSEQFLDLLNSTFIRASIYKALDNITLDHDLMIRETMELKGALEQNPVEFGEDEIKSLLLNFKNNS